MRPEYPAAPGATAAARDGTCQIPLTSQATPVQIRRNSVKEQVVNGIVLTTTGEVASAEEKAEQPRTREALADSAGACALLPPHQRTRGILFRHR